MPVNICFPIFFSVVPQTNVIVSSETTKETKHEETPLENLLSKSVTFVHDKSWEHSTNYVSKWTLYKLFILRLYV